MEAKVRRFVRRALRRLRGKKRRGAGPRESLFADRWLSALLDQLTREEGKRIRPSYTWGVLHAAHLARALGVRRISALELGVAGGNGLCALERAAIRAEELFGVDIDVFGFDSGVGLPPPRDYRDLPNLFSGGDYAMDADRLRERLERAQLLIGPLDETIRPFLESGPAAIAFIAFDLDYYTSTMDALLLLEAHHELLMPRVHCYFDDVMLYTISDYAGERLAITEFNETHEQRKISPIYGLRYRLPRRFRDSSFSEQYYMAHIFQHPRYNERDGLVSPRAGKVALRLRPRRRSP